MEAWNLQETIERIRRMEQCFDALQSAANRSPAVRWEEAPLNAQLQSLLQYYEGGQWLQDYTLDETGLLPKDLKRGVLAQDAVSDFLDQIREDIRRE